METLKLRKIYRDFGIALMDLGVGFVRKAVEGNKLTEMFFGGLKTHLLNAGLAQPASMVDYKYQSVSWDAWQELLAQVHIILSKLEYTPEFWDCDDFARVKKSLMIMLFRTTTIGTAYGKVFQGNTNNLAWMHYFNIVVTQEGQVFAHEPITGESVLMEKGKPIMFDGRRYEIISMTF